MAKVGRKKPSENVLLQSRINRIIDLMLAGIPTMKILQIVNSPQKTGGETIPPWGICDRTFWNYIKRANEEFSRASKTKFDEEYGKAVRRLNLLFQYCLKIQDYKACLAIQKELSELLGLKNRKDDEQKQSDHGLVVFGDDNEY